jgi:GIY-YIG catalytic domain-containing protein
MSNHSKLYAAYAKIYFLSNSRGSVFYVGCTTKELSIRLNEHISDARTGRYSTAKTKKIKSLKYRVFIYELERTWVTGTNAVNAVAKARHKEVYWIKEMLKQGYDLTNRENQNIERKTLSQERYQLLRKIRGKEPATAK